MNAPQPAGDLARTNGGGGGDEVHEEAMLGPAGPRNGILSPAEACEALLGPAGPC